MTDEPWKTSGSFHKWFLTKIDNILEKKAPRARINGVLRDLDEDDFGFESKTINSWRKKAPTSSFPDGKKIRDIVISPGFDFFESRDKQALVRKWAEIELVIQDNNLSDELVGFLMGMVEKSPPDFVLKCLQEVTD